MKKNYLFTLIFTLLFSFTYSQTYYSEDFEGLSSGYLVTTDNSANIYRANGADHQCTAANGHWFVYSSSPTSFGTPSAGFSGNRVGLEYCTQEQDQNLYTASFSVSSSSLRIKFSYSYNDFSGDDDSFTVKLQLIIVIY